MKPLPPEAGQIAKGDLDLFCFGLDQAITPLVLLTQEGMVLHVNVAAQSLICTTSILRIDQGRLSSRRQEETDAWVDLLADLARADPSKPSLRRMNLCDRAGRVIMILACQRVSLRKAAPLVILRVANLHTWSLLSPAWLANVFGLTTAEARVTASLFAGHDLATIAGHAERGTETVRSQLQQAMRRLGVRSQGQLRATLHCAMAAIIPDASKNDEI